MTSIVAALGGSLLRPEIENKHIWLDDLISIIRDRVAMGDRLGLVIGGGAPAREGISLVRPLIDDDYHLDKIGIAATRLNATIIREAVSEAGITVSGIIPSSVNEAVQLLEEIPVVIMGGTIPGHTTDAVAIRFAIAANAKKCIIATNVEKVYDEDPRLNPNAKSHEYLTHLELQKIVGPAEHEKAGQSSVVDPIGVSEALNAKMELNILDGRVTKRIRQAMEGDDFEGTVVSSEGKI
ncbi:TPA: UMP kinase [Candidatus Thalassarchaeaceae archaeon]|jgi:uridylate kinase|nr:UMP kinase [Euryarchaeota archaeon]MDG1548281.1 UMP kinase [Candidatus Thalassarchaeaceae archaeon]DAC63642.1 MAG TPA: UMP kinase [Candidatus Poseidoniales archaeon]MDC0502165.1 UMP kinase [Euryarchaeota archaeon]MDG1553510.1 UMP kinase [Candidatus Thalassarchaeaceae archaeon]|tara:strand:- start:2211 stop:2924 length:714 start_codon:yes stop_codon:yes gene_type:complete